jgi:hypothetical protein
LKKPNKEEDHQELIELKDIKEECLERRQRRNKDKEKTVTWKLYTEEYYCN